MLDSGQCVARARQSEKHSNHNQTGGLKRERQPLDDTHQQVEPASGPVFIEVFNEAGELVCQWADSQEERNLYKHYHKALNNTYDGKNNHQGSMEDVGDSESQTQDNGEKTNPLSIQGEVFLFEVGGKPAEDVAHYRQDTQCHDLVCLP